MNEEWRKIEGHEKYEVSNLGKVRSLKTNRMLKTWDNNGYRQLDLDSEPFSVHTLVATAFIPNPDNLPQVNHINEIRYDNRAENLEWCTPQYNTEYSQGIPVLQYTRDEDFLQGFKTASEAERITGINQSNIIQCCKGKRYSAGGYIWKYK